MTTRRDALKWAAGAGGVLFIGGAAFGGDDLDRSKFPLSLSEAQWRERLTKAEFAILRKAKTERPFSSALNDEKREGVFTCAGCGQELFRSADKFDSGTGWPSFIRPIDGAVGTARDTSFFMVRTEAHCSNCGGHLGHVFKDGPKPTGERWCINGLALNFEPSGGPA